LEAFYTPLEIGFASETVSCSMINYWVLNLYYYYIILANIHL